MGKHAMTGFTVRPANNVIDGLCVASSTNICPEGYACDEETESCLPDCDGNGIPDEDERVYVSRSSGVLSPIYYGVNQSYTFESPQEAIGDATFHFTAVGDFGASNERMKVEFNGYDFGLYIH